MKLILRKLVESIWLLKNSCNWNIHWSDQSKKFGRFIKYDFFLFNEPTLRNHKHLKYYLNYYITWVWILSTVHSSRSWSLLYCTSSKDLVLLILNSKSLLCESYSNSTFGCLWSLSLEYLAIFIVFSLTIPTCSLQWRSWFRTS